LPERVGSSEGLGLDGEWLLTLRMMPCIDPFVETLGLEPLKGTDRGPARTNCCLCVFG
jgi:hypothetical protein